MDRKFTHRLGTMFTTMAVLTSVNSTRVGVAIAGVAEPKAPWVNPAIRAMEIKGSPGAQRKQFGVSHAGIFAQTCRLRTKPGSIVVASVLAAGKKAMALKIRPISVRRGETVYHIAQRQIARFVLHRHALHQIDQPAVQQITGLAK
jgi:hypothetical protein